MWRRCNHTAGGRRAAPHSQPAGLTAQAGRLDCYCSIRWPLMRRCESICRRARSMRSHSRKRALEVSCSTRTRAPISSQCTGHLRPNPSRIQRAPQMRLKVVQARCPVAHKCTPCALLPGLHRHSKWRSCTSRQSSCNPLRSTMKCRSALTTSRKGRNYWSYCTMGGHERAASPSCSLSGLSEQSVR